MPDLYFTPAAVGYLTQVVLSCVISIYLFVLFRTRKSWSLQTIFLTAFFISITLFVGLLFLDAAFLPAPRLLVVYSENTVLAIALTFLLQFAYRFPRQFPHHKIESRLAFVVSLAYTLYEAQFAANRYYQLLELGTNNYRTYWSDYVLALILLWIPIAFLRQCIAADDRSTPWPLKLWKPQGEEARGAREFILIYCIPFALGLINLLRAYSIVSTTFFHASLSVGILVALWLFASRYIRFFPGGASVHVKLSAVTLTLFLALMGIMGWVVAPAYVNAYRPVITDHQTLRFMPNALGGYDVTPIDFHFESVLGDRLQVGYEYYNRSQKINFEFPFFGKTYFDIYATSSGMITLGEVFYHPNMQTCCIRFPAIFPLMVDLDAAGGRGVFARQETDRLIVTWDHVPALYQANQVFTFQAILYQSGAFDITYNGLPQPIRFNPDATPSANPWIRGITPGLGEAIDEGSVSDLSQSAQSGAGGLRQNFYLDFRTYLHQFTLPLAWMVFIGSLLLLLTLPILLRFVIIRPLNALLAGVYQMEAGNLKVEIPVQSPDDIGYLTNSFNKMASTLNGQVAVLEQRVSERTSELVAANERLRAEMESREEAQAQVLEQQRILTTLKERQRLARNLHDSLSQSFQSLVLFSETLIAAIEKNNLERIKQLAERVYESARQSHKETRLILYELQAPGRERSVNLIEDLEERLSKVETHAGVSSQIIQKGPLNAIPSAWHEDLYWITIEALNNALKHAQAHKIQIVIHVSPQEMELEVVDDGRGFAPDHILVGGMGLENMSARAQLLGGELTVESEPTKGTRVRFHAKIKAE